MLITTLDSFGASYYTWPTFFLGEGLDPSDLTHAKSSPLVAPNPLIRDQNAGTRTVSYSSGSISTEADYFSALKIDANVSAHYGLFSGQASLNSYEQKQFHSDSLTWYVQANVDYGRFRLGNLQLTTEAKKLAKKTDQFIQLYGTEVIFAEEREASVTAIFSISHLSSETLSSIQSSIGGSYNGVYVGGDFSAAYRRFITEVLKHTSVQYDLFAQGGKGIPLLSGSITSSNDLNQIQQKISEFVNSIDESNAPPTKYFPMPLSSLEPTFRPKELPSLYEVAIQTYYFNHIVCRQRLDALNALFARDTCWIPESTLKDLQKSEENYNALEQNILNEAAQVKAKMTAAKIPSISFPPIKFPNPRIYQMPRIGFAMGFTGIGTYGYVEGGNFDHLHIENNTLAVHYPVALMDWDEFLDYCHKNPWGWNVNGMNADITIIKSFLQNDNPTNRFRKFFLSGVGLGDSPDHYSLKLYDCQQQLVVTVPYSQF